VPAALAAIPAFGWRWALIGAACVLTVVVAPVLWRYLRDRPEQVGLLPIGGPLPPAGTEVSETFVPGGVRDLLRSRPFWGLAVPFFVCGITTTGLVDTHLIPLAQDRGISGATTGLAVALLAAANVTGILASGPLADRVDNRLLLFGLYATRGLSLVVLLSLVDAQALIGFALLFGLVDFSTVAPTQWLAARYVRPETVGVAFGCLNAVHQLGSALGAWLPGVAYDASGSYDGVLAVAAATLAVAAVTCLALPRPRRLAPAPA
jgi:predicted MFS family arabinose efflux permease